IYLALDSGACFGGDFPHLTHRLLDQLELTLHLLGDLSRHLPKLPKHSAGLASDLGQAIGPEDDQGDDEDDDHLTEANVEDFHSNSNSGRPRRRTVAGSPRP